VLTRIQATGRVTQIRSPLDPAYANQISANRHAALLQFQLTGNKISAGVVTAAVIMVFVFLTFATMSMVQLKEMGVGLAVAVLLDATIVRALLLPATMKLLGRRNWYLPRWLQWLPQVSQSPPAPAGRPPRQPVAVTGP
jgi:uncharacterized membrane protein YdfJ with MMPL/SSD domain